MFLRLNLAAFQCKELRIFTHVKLSPMLAKRIVAGSHGHIVRNVPRSALYGTLYTVKGVLHAMRADVRRVRGREYHVEFRYVAGKWPKPPKDVKSPQNLVNLLMEEPQDVILEGDAYFFYEREGKWTPAIEIPMAIKPSEEGEKPFTHVEAIRLSRRENNHKQYSVEIQQMEDGAIRHWVHLTEVWRGAMTKEVPRNFLKRSNTVSKYLLLRKQEE